MFQLPDFAQMMNTQHAQDSADVEAGRDAVVVSRRPGKADAVTAGLITKLRAETGLSRDAAYVAQPDARCAEGLCNENRRSST